MLNYKSTEAADYFASNRFNLEDYYPTEIDVLSRLIKHIKYRHLPFNIVDLGCGAGGLGNALSQEESKLIHYLGVDINDLSIDYGKRKFPELDLISMDIIDYFSSKKHRDTAKNIDLYVSLGCIDWNTEFTNSILKILNACKHNGTDFLFTFRTSLVGVDDIKESYQFVNYDGKLEGEVAGYVVLSFTQIQNIIGMFKPKKLFVSTFSGPPSVTAITPYKQLIFGCIWMINKLDDDDIFDDVNSEIIYINETKIIAYGNYDSNLFL